MMKVALFGTGLLGEPMAHRLADAGFPLAVYNRTISKTGALQARGVMVSADAFEVMKAADVFVVTLAHYPAVLEVFFSRGTPSFKGKTMIQVSTVMPGENISLKEKFQQAGGEFIESPVLGSIPQVKTGTLFLLFGGTREQLEKWDSFLSHLGDRRVFFGETGRASAAKLALNQLIASLTAAFSMSLGYLREKNVDIDKFMDILRESALYAPTFDKKFQRMMERDFSDPNFPVKHLLKDVDLIARDFNSVGINTPPLQGVLQILRESMEQGGGDLDYSALYNAIHPQKE